MTRTYLGLILGLAVAGGASAADAGFYVGGGLGKTDYSGDIAAQIQDAYADTGSYRLAAARLAESDDDGWKVFAGFRFGNGLGLELFHVDLGQAKTDYHVQVVGTVTPMAEYLLEGRYDSKGYGLVAFYEWEFLPALSAQLRGGLVRSSLDYAEATYAGVAYEYSHEGSGKSEPTYGVGLNWRVTNALDLRLDYDRYKGIGERFDLTEDGNGRFGHVDMLSLNLAFRFGK